MLVVLMSMISILKTTPIYNNFMTITKPISLEYIHQFMPFQIMKITLKMKLAQKLERMILKLDFPFDVDQTPIYKWAQIKDSCDSPKSYHSSVAIFNSDIEDLNS
jgi:hypothetical protein